MPANQRPLSLMMKIEPSIERTSEKENVVRFRDHDIYGVDGLYYFDPKFADPLHLGKHIFGSAVTTVTPRLSRTFETLEYLRPMLRHLRI